MALPSSLVLALKLGCLALYALALAAWAGVLPAALAPYGKRFETFALAFMVIHALELVFAFKHVRRYRGPLAASVALTMLFGLLHWRPLVAAPASASSQP